jgi:universal stress protein A
VTALKDPPKNILVPVDFSDSSEKATAAACALARATGATIHLLHAYLIPVEPTGLAPPFSRQYVESFVDEAKGMLGDLARNHGEGIAFGPLEVESGDPRDVINEEARRRNADLIVMGTHGRRGIQRVLLGSVAETVVRTAPCSVLVVR